MTKFVLAAAAAIVLACSIPPIQAAPAKQITFAIGWEPISFYPLRALDSASYYAQGLVYQGLIKYDAHLEMVPALAESFQVSDDRLHYTFKLRAGAKFNDGRPVTTDDVVESIKWANAPTSPYQADYEDIERVEDQDGRTVVLHLKRPCAPLLSRIVELRILPARIWRLADHGRSELSRHPVGSGPFRLRSWESGSELTFEPNPYYWGKQPSYDRLTWKIVPDHSLLALALKNGEVDVAQIEPRDWACFLSKPPGKQLALERFPGSRTIFLGFNLSKKPFDDVRVRQAIAMAIDRRALADKLYAGYATVANGDFAASSWAANKNARSWPYDPRDCVRDLHQAGFKPTKRGLLERSDGRQLAFSILTVKEYESVAESVATDLHRIGILAEVSLVEFSTLRQQYLKKGEFQTVIWSRSVGPDPECFLVWHSGGPLNLYRYSNSRVDRLLEEGRRVDSHPQRAKIYGSIQEILAQELPWVFLVHPDLLLVHDRTVKNVAEPGQEATGLPWDNPLFNAADWTKEEP